MSSGRDASPWEATPTLVRSALCGLGLLVAALALHRPDLVVLGAPFLVVAVWSVLARPSGDPTVAGALSSNRLREGESLEARVRLSHPAGARTVVVNWPQRAWVQFDPPSGRVCVDVSRGRYGDNEPVDVRTVIRSVRWGERGLGPADVTAFSEWGAYRWGPVALEVPTLTTLPVPAVFDARAPTPHPRGLVGPHTSRRPGDGSEFASVRPFHLGDRLRRIHWPTSLKHGELHVTSTLADQDTLVMLVVDATTDVGISQGIDGWASSLDVTVRAAGAVAEHYLRQGDRVGMRIIGKARRSWVPANSGRLHLTRMLDTLATISAAHPRQDAARAGFGMTSGTLVVMLSPLASADVLQRAGALVQRGLTVLLIDTLPPDYVAQATDPLNALARRIRLLERREQMDRIRAAGVAVTPWLGPGSLDHVLRQASRRDRAPTMARR